LPYITNLQEEETQVDNVKDGNKDETLCKGLNPHMRRRRKKKNKEQEKTKKCLSLHLALYLVLSACLSLFSGFR
jgi:hypothetical protein